MNSINVALITVSFMTAFIETAVLCLVAAAAGSLTYVK